MIRKFQRKFVLITMITLFFILSLIILAATSLNYYNMNSRADAFLELLSENQGNISKEDLRSLNEQSFYTENIPYEMRYFIVDFKDDTVIDRSHMESISEEEGKILSGFMLKNEGNKGTIQNMRYLIDRDHSQLYVLNIYEGQKAFENFFVNTVFISVMSLFAVFIIVSVFSKKAIKPMTEGLLKQRRFITDAGHEIKTPLSIIAANCEVLELQYGRNEWIESTQNQVRRMNLLIKNLLTLAKMDEENIDIHFVTLNLSEIAEEIIQPFTVLADQKGIEVQKRIEKNLYISADPNRISHLISILMDNSIKYTPVDGVIEIYLERKGKNIIFDFINTVEKMPEGNLERLFDRFHREDDSRTSEGGGYGIGLSLARAVVKSHGGRIRASKAEKDKIRFRVEFSSAV
ncbi:MAG: HAMP domain-containing histidine kinase [Gallicola sp.]|uniref:sensor histidine kinase n=1 Tax=Gallicola sp. Sow4_E12 TaxID=3438785 RepID=UPI0017ABFD38|nr:HAMP domain-containing histidine kinase [Gallicola sp.]